MCVVTVTDATPAPPSAPHHATRHAKRGRGEKCAACDHAHRLFTAGVTAVWRGDLSRNVFACVAQSICILGFHALDRGAVGTNGGTCDRSTLFSYGAMSLRGNRAELCAGVLALVCAAWLAFAGLQCELMSTAHLSLNQVGSSFARAKTVMVHRGSIVRGILVGTEWRHEGVGTAGHSRGPA
jgi:hypothetical protein